MKLKGINIYVSKDASPFLHKASPNNKIGSNWYVSLSFYSPNGYRLSNHWEGYKVNKDIGNWRDVLFLCKWNEETAQYEFIREFQIYIKKREHNGGYIANRYFMKYAQKSILSILHQVEEDDQDRIMDMLPRDQYGIIRYDKIDTNLFRCIMSIPTKKAG